MQLWLSLDKYNSLVPYMASNVASATDFPVCCFLTAFSGSHLNWFQGLFPLCPTCLLPPPSPVSLASDWPRLVPLPAGTGLPPLPILDSPRMRLSHFEGRYNGCSTILPSAGDMWLQFVFHRYRLQSLWEAFL